MRKVLALSCLLALSFVASGPTQAAPSEASKASAQEKTSLHFNFNGKEYFHRWSKNNQNEFTPEDQPDLEKWQDMVTINVLPAVKTGEQLSEFANKTLGKYAQFGKIIRTNSKPKTEKKLAEHLAVAILGDPKFVETVFARFVVVDEHGMAIIFSHRVYGEKVGAEASKYLREHGEETENFLMAWDKMPHPTKLMSLPQSAK